MRPQLPLVVALIWLLACLSGAAAQPLGLIPFTVDYPLTATEPVVTNLTNFVHTAGVPGLAARYGAVPCPEAQGKTIEEVFALIGTPGITPVCDSLKNIAGAYYNHALFFDIMGPINSTTFEDDASQELKDAILGAYGSYAAFVQKINTTSAAVFGPGWTWLCVTDDGSINMTTSVLQDNPLMTNIYPYPCTPFFGLDFWEHAYFLTYLSNRVQYTVDWMQVVDWTKVSQHYASAKAGGPLGIIDYVTLPSPSPAVPSPSPAVPPPTPSPTPTQCTVPNQGDGNIGCGNNGSNNVGDNNNGSNNVGSNNQGSNNQGDCNIGSNNVGNGWVGSGHTGGGNGPNWPGCKTAV